MSLRGTASARGATRLRMVSSNRSLIVDQLSYFSFKEKCYKGNLLNGSNCLFAFRSKQCSTTVVTKAEVYAILSVGWCI